MYYQKKLQEKQLQNSTNFKTATTKQITKRQLPHSNYKTNYKTAYAHLCTSKKKLQNLTTNRLPSGNYQTVTTRQTTKQHMPIYILTKNNYKPNYNTTNTKHFKTATTKRHMPIYVLTKKKL